MIVTLGASARSAPGEGSLKKKETNERKKITMEKSLRAPSRSDFPQRVVVAWLPIEHATDARCAYSDYSNDSHQSCFVSFESHCETAMGGVQWLPRRLFAPLEGLIPNWQNHLGLFLALTEASRIPAGDIYETVGLPRFKKHRCPKVTVVVKAFMNDLGWYYRDNGTQPYFAERKKPQRLTILKRVSNETEMRQTKD